MAAVPSLTLVLMGRTGNGKSATGNSILGKKAFLSKKSSSGITKTSNMEGCVRTDGQVINVIDTPGMFDLSSGTGSAAKEIMKCMKLASEGIHAVILVFSVRNRFTQEEEATIQTLQNTFGPKIVDYTIVILTGGDEFEDDDDIEDYLSHECPVALKNILAACKNRCVIFDNKTKNEVQKDEQVNELLDLVKEIIDQNGGQPYKPPLISNLKLEKEFDEVKRKLEQSCTQEIYSDPMLEEKLNECMLEVNHTFQRQLDKEREARRQVEEKTQQMQKQYNDEIEKHNELLRISLQRAALAQAQQNPKHPNLIGRGSASAEVNMFQRQLEEEREACCQVDEKTQQMLKQYNDEIEKYNKLSCTSLQTPASAKVQQNLEHPNLIGRGSTSAEVDMFQRQLEEERKARRQIEEKTRQIQKQYNDETKKLNDLLRISLQRPTLVEVEQSSEYNNLIQAIIRRLRSLIRSLF